MVFTLRSPAFEDGDPIPERYGYLVSNANPPLTIRGVPESAASLALVMDDPDAVEPAGRVWDHWLVWNIDPAIERIPADWDCPFPEGENDYGERGYGGPNPPDREHTYRFRLFALETSLDLESGGTKGDLIEALQGQVLEEAHLEGTYTP
ncbi:MAG: YbhB/YbcL family Raf kinase inhibitor-like protein [Halodesulfurarchaeum sp.]